MTACEVRGIDAHPGILTIGDPRLRARAKPAVISPATLSVAKKMVQVLREIDGAGLAAPLIGEPIRVIAVEVRGTDVYHDRPQHPLTIVINPTVVALSDDEEVGWEQCFSVPDLVGQVQRAHGVRLAYSTPSGVSVERDFEGYLARVMLHEMDHLDGVLFVDRLTTTGTLTTVANHRRWS